MSNLVPVRYWVIDDSVTQATLERIGEARCAAGEDRVGVLVVSVDQIDTCRLIEHGADDVVIVTVAGDQCTRVDAAVKVLTDHCPQLILAGGNAHGREWAARLAVRAGWQLVTPALLVHRKDDSLIVTALDRTGRLSRPVEISREQTAVATLRAGVAEVLPPDATRSGTVRTLSFAAPTEPITQRQHVPADPATVDIRYAPRLVAGGRGLGDKQGFETLRAFADRIGAGVAASRMAVDLGWIDRERQIGQTGKTVKPDLYIACGISGASHHLDGMSGAKHIIAINTDPAAPIFKVAHLGLVADLYEVLKHTTP